MRFLRYSGKKKLNDIYITGSWPCKVTYNLLTHFNSTKQTIWHVIQIKWMSFPGKKFRHFYFWYDFNRELTLKGKNFSSRSSLPSKDKCFSFYFIFFLSPKDKNRKLHSVSFCKWRKHVIQLYSDTFNYIRTLKCQRGYTGLEQRWEHVFLNCIRIPNTMDKLAAARQTLMPPLTHAIPKQSLDPGTVILESYSAPYSSCIPNPRSAATRIAMPQFLPKFPT